MAQAGLSIGAPDPAAVYRTLRQMEQDGLVLSHWDPSSHGPRKRTYELSSDGEDLLHTWAQSIQQNREVLTRYLALYQTNIRQVSSEASLVEEEAPLTPAYGAQGRRRP
jgi:DNA-binding PadR family transcriptional regulator